MSFDRPEGSIKRHEVKGPSKDMRFLGKQKHEVLRGEGFIKNMRNFGSMRFQKWKLKHGSIKGHEV